MEKYFFFLNQRIIKRNKAKNQTIIKQQLFRNNLNSSLCYKSEKIKMPDVVLQNKTILC